LAAPSAKKRRLSPQELYDLEVTKRISDPTEVEIKQFIEANKDQVADADPQNLQDVRNYVQNFVRRHGEVMAARIREWNVNQEEFIAKITESSEGNFMYLVHVLDDIYHEGHILAEGIGEQDFVGYMTHLGLAHPKQMDVAVPANLKCGRPEKTTTLDPDWAPLTYTFAGIWEVQPHWLEEHLREVQIVDVREPDEFNGPLGHVPGARLIPLGTLSARANELAQAAPTVTVCRSGARSAQATVILGKCGFEKVANLSGGMLRWRAQRYAVDGGAD